MDQVSDPRSPPVTIDRPVCLGTNTHTHSGDKDHVAQELIAV